MRSFLADQQAVSMLIKEAQVNIHGFRNEEKQSLRFKPVVVPGGQSSADFKQALRELGPLTAATGTGPYVNISVRTQNP